MLKPYKYSLLKPYKYCLLKPYKTSKFVIMIVILTHKYCYDGNLAHIIADQFYSLSGGENVVYHSYLPGSRLLNELQNMVARYKKSPVDITAIRCFDLSMGVEHLKCLLELCSDVEIHDHHVTTEQSFNDADDDIKSHLFYDISVCGAELAWKYYFHDKPQPKIVTYIGDNDLWRHPDKRSKAICEAIYNTIQLNDKQEWERLLTMTDSDVEKWEAKMEMIGNTLLEVKKKRIGAIIKRGQIYERNGLRVYVVNAIYDKSDIGNTAVVELNCDYAAIWNWDPSSRRYWVSLRSDNKKDDSPDVSMIAKEIQPSGGGHRNAAGFDIGNLNEFIENYY